MFTVEERVPTSRLVLWRAEAPFDRIIDSFLGRQRFTFEVTGYGPNGRLDLRATSGPVRPIVTYRVESTGQGTRLTARIDVHTRGCFGSWSHR